MRIRGWCVALLLLLGSVRLGHGQVLPPSILPGLGPGAGRSVVDVTQPPWRGVVLVQTDVGLRCTGALVGLRLVLTAAHCLFGRNTGRVVQPGSIHVLTGYSHGEYAGHARAVSFEIGAGFGLGADGRLLPTATADADWAVLTLGSELGTPDRVLPVARELPPAGTPVMLGGYEQDRAHVLLADTACRVLDLVKMGGAVLLRHDCAATRGASGAPLLGRVADGWVIVGLAAIAGVGAPGGYAVPASAIAARSAVLP